MADNSAPQILTDLDAVLGDTVLTKEVDFSFNMEAKKAGRTIEKVPVGIDFTGLTLRQILERYAVKSAVIDLQRAMRTAPDEETMGAFLAGATAESPLVVEATEAGKSPWATNERTSDPLKRATNAVAKMTDEQKEALRALLDGDDS